MARFPKVKLFDIIESVNKTTISFRSSLLGFLFSIQMNLNQKDKDESFMLVALFWPIWLFAIVVLAFLLYLSG